MTEPRVVIVEDHPIFRDGLATALAAGGIEVVAAVGRLAEAHQVLSQVQVDVVLLDLGLPDGSGVDLLATLRTRYPHIAVVVLTMSEDRPTMLAAIREGARGYLLKGSGRSEIVQAVRRAHAGGSVYDRGAADVLRAIVDGGDGSSSGLGLTPRERDVLRLLGQGLTNAAIATRLGVSAKTARNQVSMVLAKLGVTGREQAASRAKELGL